MRDRVPAIIIITLFLIILVAGFWSVLSHLNSNKSGLIDQVSDKTGDRNQASLIANNGNSSSQNMPYKNNSGTNLIHTYTPSIK
jgi:hypothetical protein